MEPKLVEADKWQTAAQECIEETKTVNIHRIWTIWSEQKQQQTYTELLFLWLNVFFL